MTTAINTISKGDSIHKNNRLLTELPASHATGEHNLRIVTNSCYNREKDMVWQIEPLKGIGQIKFGMNLDDLSKLLGSPTSMGPQSHSIHFKNNGIRVSLEQGKVSEISITPLVDMEFEYSGIVCFQDSDLKVLRALESASGQAFEEVGFIIFPKIGVMASGMHDKENSQLAITISNNSINVSELIDAKEITFLDQTK